jgi:signal transduction histidine kinase/CheY-like chemotaxis protein/amino acid permease
MKPSNAMRKFLSPFAAWGLAFGFAVGWGSFVMPGASFLPGAGPLGTAIAVAVGAAAMLVFAWNYHVLVRKRPGSGGAFAYAHDVLGPDYGFLVGWSLLLAYLAILWANATALVLLFRHLAGGMFQFGFHYRLAGFDVWLGEAAVCVAAIAAAGILCLAKRAAARVNLALMLLFSACVALCFAAALAKHEGGLAAMAPPFAPGTGRGPLRQVLSILGMMPWAFVGFEAISNLSGEFAFDARRSFRLMAWAVAAAAVAYVALALLPTLAHPDEFSSWPDYLAGAKHLEGIQSMPTFAAARRALGPLGVGVLAAAMFAGISTGIIASVLATSRLLHGLSEYRVFPAWVGRLDANGTPRNAILLVTVFSAVVPFFGRTAIGWPVDMSSIGAAVAYCAVSAAALAEARKSGRAATKATGWCGIWMSVVFSLLLLVPKYLSGGALAAESYLMLASWVLLGFAVYRLVFKRDPTRFGRSMAVWLGALALVLFSSLMWVRQISARAIRDEVDGVSSFYFSQYRTLTGADPSAEAEAQAHAYLDGAMELLERRLLAIDLVQLSLPVFAILLMFSLYRTQQAREKSLELAKTRAEANNRAKSGFLSNISHDIRTPLNAIIGYTELAEDDGTDEAALRGYVAKVREAGRSLLALLDDVLEMSRIESGKVELDPVPMDLADTLDQFNDLFAPQMAFKGVAFSVDVSGVRDRFVLCDKVRLDRMLLNLVGNALKFTPRGGSVSLACRQLPGAAAGGAAAYELRVRDTGIGMSPAFAERVFEPFERERTSTVSGIQGTGLGMAITKRIAELMHGAISVASEKGKGTEFTVRIELPLVPEGEVAAAAGRETRGHDADFTGKRLLLAEDNEANRDIAARILSDAGFEVDCAANGREAVDKVAGGGPGRYDIVLMDINMPVMDGLAAVRAIRALARPGVSDVRIMALSANAFDSDIHAAFEAGVDGHATKPYRRQVLLERIAGMIGGGPAGAYAPLVRGRQPRILFADDSKLNHTVMAMHFRKLRIEEVAFAKDGAEALEKLRNPGPRAFDLLVTDLQMPGMDGGELVRAVRADPALAKLPVFVFTADDAFKDTYASLGFTGALIKPASSETIKAMLDSITAKPA